MFPFTITYKRRIEFHEKIETDSFFMEIRNTLNKNHEIKKTKTFKNKLSFNVNLIIGVSNWDLFGTVDKAEIFLDKKILIYKISILRFVIIVFTMSLFAASFISFPSNTLNKIDSFLSIFTFIITFLGGLNLIITLIRHYYYSNELAYNLSLNQSK